MKLLIKTNIQNTVNLFKTILKKSLAPIIKITVSEWADKYRYLTGNAEPGKWNSDRAPYQRVIMDAFTDPHVHEIVGMLASQTGKSDMMNNVIGRFAHIDPCPIMMVQPTILTAEDYSKTRIAPMIQVSPVLRRIFHDVKSRNTNNTIMSKLFPGGRLILVGSNSASDLSSKPIRILLCDEVDRFAESAGTEGDPVDLASKRLSTFWNYIKALFSTPGVEGNSRIAAEYYSGTQEEWQHQCPNCGEFVLIEWQQMQVDFEERKNPHKIGQKIILVKNITWHCPHCGYGFDEQTMRNQPQKFVAQTPEAIANGIRSFFVNIFASPWIHWDTVAKEYLEAKGDPEREQVVVNTRFALPYRLKGDFDDETIFLNRRENYAAEVPAGALLLTCAVDTQDNRLEYEVCGWGRGEECWAIQKGVIIGVPDTQKVWDELDAILDKEYQHESGHKMLIARTFIDSGGHYAPEVYKYCIKNKHKQRFAIKGWNIAGAPLLYRMGKAKEYNATLIYLGVDSGKQYVMDRLSIETPGPKYFHYPLPTADASQGYDDVYFKGLLAEKLMPRTKNGQVIMSWVNVAADHRNEPLDLRVYGIACRQSINVNLDKIEQALANKPAPVEPSKPRGKKRKKFGSASAPVI